MVIIEKRKAEKLSGEIPIEERAKHSEDCEICGSEATFRCPKCGSSLCDGCKQNPCEWEHYSECMDEEEKDPNYEEEQTEDEDFED